jgi:DNA mismatch repair protein MutS2
LRVALAARREDIEGERSGILQAAQREAEDTLATMRRELDAVRRRDAHQAFDQRAAEETLRRLDADLARLAKRAKPQRAQPVAAEAVPSVEVEAGDTVHVRDIPQLGEALSGVGEDGRVEVQFGSLRMKVSVDRIDRVDTNPNVTVSRGAPPVDTSPPRHVPVELDLRGRRAEEALEVFEGYVDDAFRAGLPFVRIIHGKGTGALRAAIREALAGHPLVRRYESAPP